MKCVETRSITSMGIKVKHPDYEHEEATNGVTYFNIETPHTVDNMLEKTKEIAERWDKN